MSRDLVLLGDIGGSNARFAIASGNRILQSLTLEVAHHRTATDAIARALDGLADDRSPRAAALACAGPVEDDIVAMTNSGWQLDARDIRRRFGFSEVLLLNDFAALAWALPRLEKSDLQAIGRGTAEADRTAVVLGPGTGLGIAACLPTPNGPEVIVGEGGHATMPAASDREADVIAKLRAELGHVSAESLLSGDGLVRLYETISALEGRLLPTRSPAGISEAARDGSCPASRAALDMFCAMLGTVAGNLALTFGARGGVYIAGGIVPQISDSLAASNFRRRFESKGRFQPYLSRIPTWVILHRQPAFLGLLRHLHNRR